MVGKVSASLALADGSGSTGAPGRRFSPDFRVGFRLTTRAGPCPLTIWLRLHPALLARPRQGLDSAAFRKLLSELLQSALTQAKYHKNIEIDLLFRLSLLKFLTSEIGNQFANIILEGKEWIRQRGEHFERSQQAHVIKARLSELQASRRQVVRRVGQQVAQILAEIEENSIAKPRRALSGEDFAPYYELCKNRLIFLDGGKDDLFFLEY